MEFHRKHRPNLFKQVLGQPEAVKTLQTLINSNKVPHAVLFTGPSGTGKTTLARILAAKLKCHKDDFYERNFALDRGIDLVRSIEKRIHYKSFVGPCQIWLLDEAARGTVDAQSALLKLLEEPPSWVYFFLATTDPHKLLKTIHTRCTEIQTQALPANVMETLLKDILKKESKSISDEVIERLIEVAEGSARKALVLLEQIIELEDEQEQLDSIIKSDLKNYALELARKLMNYDNKTKWPEVSSLLEKVDGEDPEKIRHLVLSFARTTMLRAKQHGKGPGARAYMILCAFEGSFFESKSSGLARACWEVMGQK